MAKNKQNNHSQNAKNDNKATSKIRERKKTGTEETVEGTTVEEQTKIKFNFLRCFLEIFVIITPIVWFSWIYPENKYNWNLMDANTNKATLFGIILNIAIVLAVIFGIFLSCVYNMWASTKAEFEALDKKCKKKASELIFLEKELEFTEVACTLKSNTLIKYVTNYKKSTDPNEHKLIPKIITNPQKQIQCLITALRDSVSVLIDQKFNSDDVSVAWKFGDASDWAWIEGFAPNGNTNITELSTQHSSTFYKVIHKKDESHYICYSSKLTAFSEQEYYAPDKSAINEGIIIAKHFFVNIGEDEKDNDIIAEIVLFLTTKSQAKEKVIYNIDRFKKFIDEKIFERYTSRIRIELLLYYISMINQT